MKKAFKTLDFSLITPLLIITSIGISLYVFFVLTFNVSKGFDITDESFYILSAQAPESIFASTTSFGYYTGLLYLISGENLALFKLMGILILVITSFFFSTELYKYVLYITKATPSRNDFALFILPIITASLAYYRYWLITPSYNWLNLIGIILFSIGLIRHINLFNANKKSTIYSASILIAFGGTLTFLAKPTTTIILFIITVLWSFLHFKQMKWKTFITSTLFFILIFINFHIFVYEGGYIEYYNKIINGMSFLQLLGSRHTLSHIIEETQLMLTGQTFKSFYIFSKDLLMGVTILIFSSLLIAVFLFKKIILSNRALIVRILLGIFTIFYAYTLYNGVLSVYSKTHLWICVFELLTVLTIICVLIKGFDTINWKISDSLGKIIFLVVFLNILNFSYAFGTANHLIHIMSNGALFSISSLVFIGYLIDAKFKQKIFLTIINIISVFYILIVINYAYNHPYRLVTNISQQNTKVSLSIIENKKNFINVDSTTAKYINDLQSIALANGWKTGNTLIDMTGGTPGANVILDAGFIGIPWLFGGYPGSDEFVSAVLSSGNINTLKTAWILTAPEGVRQLPTNILKKFGLDFPNCYIKAGTVKTGHRNETQELWKVKIQS